MNGIKEARKKAGMTQKEMADFFGMPKRNIENWEGGKNDPPEWVEKLITEKLEKLTEDRP